jgi:tetratricopeptide (TPR) repeat protein/transcriptional regulator with XRE-family HTH domain
VSTVNGHQGLSLGEFLSGLRSRAGKTQEELAEDSGLSVRSISDLERDRISRPRRRSLELLASALNLDPAHAKALIAIACRAPTTRQVMARELGTEPGTELSELHRRILAADARQAVPAAAAGTVPRQLPAAGGHFAGRAAELALLDGLLDEASREAPGAVVISAVGGAAGVGKTTLAVHWAHRAAHRFGDGQLYVNLRGFGPSGSPVTPGEAIRGFLDALGVPPERVPRDPQSRSGLYRSLLAGRRMLIVLDNARDEQQVRPLLPAGPRCLVIVTSRSQLSGLAAADGARLLPLDVLSPAEARQLLAARLGRRAEAEPDAAGEIARLCAGLPLALAIAAACAAARPRLPLAGLAAMLSDARGRLDALDTGDPAMNVRTVFSWSVRQLSPVAARMFALLGLHPGPDCTAPAAASLAAIPLPEAARALRQLATASLLTEHRPGRYAFHDLLRAYAAERAEATADGGERRAATGRILGHYLHTARTATMLLDPAREQITLAPAQPGVLPEVLADQQQATAWFDAEHPVLSNAVVLASGSGFDDFAWQLPWAMADFLQWRGRWQELAAIERAGLAAATRLGDLAGQAAISRRLGYTYTWLGDYAQATACLAECLELYVQLGDRSGQARVHQGLCHVAEQQGRPADALGHAGQALRLFQATGYREGQAVALGYMGWYHALLGDYHQARDTCQQALGLYRELGHLNFEGPVWDSLGYAEHHLGNFAEAATCYQRSLTLAREADDRHSEAVVLDHLGDTFLATGEHAQARQAWQQALDIFNDLHHSGAAELQQKLLG